MAFSELVPQEEERGEDMESIRDIVEAEELEKRRALGTPLAMKAEGSQDDWTSADRESLVAVDAAPSDTTLASERVDTGSGSEDGFVPMRRQKASRLPHPPVEPQSSRPCTHQTPSPNKAHSHPSPSGDSTPLPHLTLAREKPNEEHTSLVRHRLEDAIGKSQLHPL